ncbi:MAG: PAS domain S-box protein [Deltaproteobacteria bacterium]
MAENNKAQSKALSLAIDNYREIFYKLNIIVLLHDREGNIYEVNDKFIEVFGYSANEIDSLNITALQTSETLNAHGKIIEETLKNGSTNCELILKKKNRETFPACVHTKLLEFDDERLILCVIDDISELKKAETEFYENKLFFDSIIENIADMIFLKEAENLRFVRLNRAGEELIGYTSNDLLGKNDYDIFHKEQADFFMAKDREVLRSGKVLEIEEEPIHTKDKGLRILHTKKIAIKDENNKSKYLLGISEDITGRKELEGIKRIRDLAFETITNGIIVTGTDEDDYPVNNCNAAFLKMTGYAREEVIGKNCRFLQGTDTDQEALTELRAALEKGKPFNGLLRNYKKDGTLFWNELIVAPVRDDSGSLTHFVGILNDITERKKAKDELKKTYNELEIKIAERTAELVELNKKLKSEIEVRKKAEDALRSNVEQLSRKNRYEEIISTVTRIVHQSLDLNEVLENAVDVISKNVENASVVMTYFVEHDTAVLQTNRGLTEEYIRKAGRIPFGKGAVWHTILEGKCRYVSNIDEDKIIGNAGRTLGQKSYLAVPLISSNETVGVIAIASTEEDSFDDEEIRLLKIVSNQIETAINNAKQAESLKENLERLSRKNRYEEIVCTVTQSVNQSTELQEVLENAVESMCSNIEVADHVSIYFVEGEHAVMKAHRGYPEWFLERIMRIPKPVGFTWACINEDKVVHCPDAENDSVIGPAGKEVGTKSYVAIPLTAQGNTIGCIDVHSLNKNAFDKDDINLLEVVGEQIEIAINKSRDAEALRNSEERYRTLYQENPSMYFTINEDGNVLSVNRNGVEKLGYTEEELIGCSVVSVFHEEDKPKIKEQLINCFENPDQIFRWKLRKVCKNGSVIWVNELARCVIDAGGSKVALVACEDVTEQKKAEDDKREAEERYRTIVENTYNLIIETDILGNISYANPRHKELLGYGPEEMIGMNCLDLVYEDDRMNIAAAFRRAASTGEAIQTARYRCKRKDGNLRWLESTGRAYRDANGEIRGVISSRDITERKLAEDRRKEVEERYRALVENTYDLIIEISPDCKFLYVSPNHTTALGYEQEELIGNSIFENIHPDDTQEVLSNFRRIALNIINSLGLNVDDILTDNNFANVDHQKIRELWIKGERAIEKYLESEHSLIYRYKTKNGKWVWLESTGRPFWTSSGELRIVISSRDVTERKLSEDKLQKAFSEIEQLKNQLEQENIYLQEEVKLRYHYGEIYGESKALKSALSLAEQVANTESTVLILGETGTGKELLAHAIHNMSPRKGRPMVMVNCATLPATLVETELFGHEKGAFTGATYRRAGRFEVADGSTIFLDEVGELPLELQSKLLRVLQTGQFERIGGSSTISVDARVIAATNRDMLQAVEEGSFRQDLYYRLNVFPIKLPPLRERKEDTQILVKAFVKEFSNKMGKKIHKIPKKVMNSLVNYRWPGNVRELRNVIERAVIITKDDKLNIDLPSVERQSAIKAKSLNELEKNHIVEILNTTNWRIRGKAGAAELLGLKPTTLESRMRRLGIERYKLDSTISS